MMTAIPMTEDVMQWLRQFVRCNVPDSKQRKLIDVALEGFSAELDNSDLPPCFYLPPLVSRAIEPATETTLAITAVSTMIYLGVDIFDDLADNDLPSHWNGCDRSEISLVAATLFSALPVLAIAKLDILPSQVVSMQRVFGEGLLRMAGGQHADLEQRAITTPDPSKVEMSLAGKTGAELAMFAALAAIAAGASENAIANFCEMASAFGVASQLSSDCYDLFEAGWSKDLANGTRTLPLATHLASLPESDRTSFLNLLECAERDPEAQGLVREQLRAAGALRRCALLIEVQCQRARNALERARPIDPAATELHRRIGRASPFCRQKISSPTF